MRGAKELHGKRVRLLVSAFNKAGQVFKKNEEGTFKKEGVVRCSFETDDGRRIQVDHWNKSDFEVVSGAPCPVDASCSKGGMLHKHGATLVEKDGRVHRKSKEDK